MTRLPTVVDSVVPNLKKVCGNVIAEEDRRNEELFDQQLRDFEDYVLGRAREPDNFYDNY